MPFDNSYARLPDRFFQTIAPEPVKAPKLIRLNHDLVGVLDLDLPQDQGRLAAVFSGNELLSGSDPIAMAYAGHQFGHFAGPLGDGRAVLLGEVVDKDGQRFDIQLKGSGRTRFSRNGDGRSPLGPVIREYVVSEAMHALCVPTTRALAMVETGETVQRETRLPGGVFSRVASSHIRVGTFEYFASQKDEEAVRILADYAIDRHYPEAREAENSYVALFESVCRAQARLVAKWMGLGFIHGVMNTDNTTISGETIDYGPCAFMDQYDPATVFSSIDHQGRYAYNNQPAIARWNMACLGGCLIPLLHEETKEAHRVGEGVLDMFVDEFKVEYQAIMCRKIGLEYTDENFDLLSELLTQMAANRADFTLSFHYLSENTDGFKSLFSDESGVTQWLSTRRSRITDPTEARKMMRSVNPVFIPRNHRIEAAIQAAEQGDFSLTHTLIDILKQPFNEQSEHKAYMTPPTNKEAVKQTFCGT